MRETEGGVNPELEQSHSMLAQYLPLGFTFLGFRWLLMFLFFFTWRKRMKREVPERLLELSSVKKNLFLKTFFLDSLHNLLLCCCFT